MPILLYDPVGCAIGAVHAGWRGTVRDIAGKSIEKMVRELGSDPSDIRAAIGPCISVCCYETGGDVAGAVNRALGSDASGYVIPRGKKFQTDLKGINSLLLTRGPEARKHCGIARMHVMLMRKYWSHRVTRGKRGSQASIIVMKGSMN